jgi:hypothetical protein
MNSFPQVRICEVMYTCFAVFIFYVLKNVIEADQITYSCLHEKLCWEFNFISLGLIALREDQMEFL